MEIGKIMRKILQSSNDKNALEQKTSRLILFLDFWVMWLGIFIIIVVELNVAQRTELIKQIIMKTNSTLI